jgi:serine/threonine protein kinase
MIAMRTGAIGPYRLLQQVGEGGMGVVWLAKQTRPVRRQVALKIIKVGMDTIIKGNFGDKHPRTQVALKRLVDLYDAWGKPAKAT